MPKVSIVLPTYNGEKYIKESIDSVIHQTFTDWELIIVNDCSTDSTPNIIKEYENIDSRIRIINNSQNLKLPKSLNVGFKSASGEYLTWISDDNLFLPQAIEAMVSYLETSNVDLVSCKYDEIDENGKLLNTIDKHNKRNLHRFLRRNVVGACFMYTKKIADKIGQYDENVFCAEDYDYWFRIALAGNIKFIPECYYQYRFNPYSLSSTKQDLIKKKSLEVREKYVLKLMDKLNYSSHKKIKTLIELYKRNIDEKIWLKMAIDIDANEFIKSVFYYMFFYNIKLYLRKGK